MVYSRHTDSPYSLLSLTERMQECKKNYGSLALNSTSATHRDQAKKTVSSLMRYHFRLTALLLG